MSGPCFYFYFLKQGYISYILSIWSLYFYFLTNNKIELFFAKSSISLVLGLFVLHHVKQIEKKKTNHQAESIENEL
jgi:hypothetical protein